MQDIEIGNHTKNTLSILLILFEFISILQASPWRFRGRRR